MLRTPFASVEPIGTGSPAFRVATYNVHSCVGTDGRFAPGRIADAIGLLDADVVGLQEVGWHSRGERGFDQFAWLARATGYRVHAGLTLDGPTARYGNALMTRLPLLRATSLNLSVGRREPRGAIDAEILVGGQVVRVAVAHLGLARRERLFQIGRLLAHLGEGRERPLVMLGDLNEWRRSSLGLRGLRQALPRAGAPRSYPAGFPTLRLDRIHVSRDLGLAEVAAVRTALTRRASDHLPVRATVTLAVGQASGRSAAAGGRQR